MKSNVNMLVVQKIVVGGVVIRAGKALILQRSPDEKIYPGLWELPSGKREIQEQTLKALKREILEETGLQVKSQKLLSVFDYKIKKPNEIRDSVQVNFLVRVKPGSVQVSHEHTNFAWVDLKSYKNYPMTKPVARAIRLALEKGK